MSYQTDKDTVAAILAEPDPGPTWRECWREGYAPQLDPDELAVLRDALDHDDPQLIQGRTVVPAFLPRHLAHTHDAPVAGACAIGLCGWRGRGLTTTDDVHVYFSRVMMSARNRLGGHAEAVRFLQWFDATPRDQMRPLLLEEVEREIARRKEVTG